MKEEMKFTATESADKDEWYGTVTIITNTETNEQETIMTLDEGKALLAWLNQAALECAAYRSALARASMHFPDAVRWIEEVRTTLLIEKQNDQEEK